MSFWTTLRDFFLDLRNGADYPLRQFFRWRRGDIHWKNEPKDHLFADLPPAERQLAEQMAENLRQTYHLDQFYNHSRARIYRENLYYLALLEQALQKAEVHLGDALICTDVGPSDWFYVQALYHLLYWYNAPQGRKVTLFGYERDAFRVYADFYSRYDHAHAYLKGLKGVTYIPKAFEAQPGRFDLIFMLFPFVFLEDHLRWGLPRRLFQPRVLLSAVWQSLKPGGGLIIANQGLAEHLEQQRLLQEAAVPIRAAFCFDSPLYRYSMDRYVLVAIHP
jgi:SAM-dependent methyltransferase